MRAKDFFKNEQAFSTLLDDAEDKADNEWEMNFVSSMIAKYEDYGMETFLSDDQLQSLHRIADK